MREQPTGVVEIRCERFGDLKIPLGARTFIFIGKLSLDQHPGCIIRSIRYDVSGGSRKRTRKYSAHNGLREPLLPRFTDRGLIEASTLPFRTLPQFAPSAIYGSRPH